MNDDRWFVLGVDLDGVCGDYTAAFRAVVAAERGIDPDSLPEERGWDFTEWGVDELGGFEHVHRTAVLDHRMFRDMPVVEGAAEALWRLSDAGVWIRIITHRLYVNWGHAVAVADTVEWLDHHAIPYRDICFLGRKPEVEADCYVDDSPENIEALRAAGNQVIVFDQPYNVEVAGPRASTWEEVEQLVAAQVAERGVPLQPRLPGVDDGIDRLRGRLR
jgi:5'(3')-deoxyribonucleotidase